MLKRCTAFAVMALPVSVFAEMPIVNTDMVKADETIVSVGTSFLRQEAKVETVNFGALYQGDLESDQQKLFITVGRGLTDRLSVYLSGSYITFEQDQALVGPTDVVIERDVAGLNNPELILEYKPLPGPRAVVVSIDVSPSTSSDSAGQNGISINGVMLQPTREGDAGTGATRITSRIAGSMQKEGNVLEWGFAAYLDDEKNTENAYEVQLGWLHRCNEQTSVRIGGTVYQQDGMKTAMMSTDDVLHVGGSIALMHQPSPDLRLSLSYQHMLLDDFAARSSVTTNSDRYTDGLAQSVSLGMAYLFK